MAQKKEGHQWEEGRSIARRCSPSEQGLWGKVWGGASPPPRLLRLPQALAKPGERLI